MIICPKCNGGNPDNTILCKECGSSIAGIAIDKTEYLENLIAKQEKNSKIAKLCNKIALSIIGVLYIFFYIKSLIAGVPFVLATINLILFPPIAYTSIYHPNILFYLGHMHTIYNINDVVLTDYYIIGTKISGYVAAVVGLACLVALSMT